MKKKIKDREDRGTFSDLADAIINLPEPACIREQRAYLEKEKESMYQAFVVAAKRSDGSMPKLCKAMHDKIFFTPEDAHKFKQQLSEEYGWNVVFAVYEISVEMLKEVPDVEKD